MSQDDEIALTSAKRWHEGTLRRQAKIFTEMGYDPAKAVSDHSAQCVIDGRLIRFSDQGEPYFAEDDQA